MNVICSGTIRHIHRVRSVERLAFSIDRERRGLEAAGAKRLRPQLELCWKCSV
jgi:hypothetical protein